MRTLNFNTLMEILPFEERIRIAVFYRPYQPRPQAILSQYTSKVL